MIDLSEEPMDENIETCKVYLERMAKMDMLLEMEVHSHTHILTMCYAVRVYTHEHTHILTTCYAVRVYTHEHTHPHRYTHTRVCACEYVCMYARTV